MYQGYKNYQTWNVALWIGNEYGLYRHWQDRAANIKDKIANIKPGDCLEAQDGTWTAEQVTRNLLADELKADIGTHPLDSMSAQPSSKHSRIAPPKIQVSTMYSDILTHAMGQVDWHEVADSILDE